MKRLATSALGVLQGGNIAVLPCLYKQGLWAEYNFSAATVPGCAGIRHFSLNLIDNIKLPVEELLKAGVAFCSYPRAST